MGSSAVWICGGGLPFVGCFCCVRGLSVGLGYICCRLVCVVGSWLAVDLKLECVVMGGFVLCLCFSLRTGFA